MTDALIIGGGISGVMMAARLNKRFPTMKVTIVDKASGDIHPFHLHRPIPELPFTMEIKPVLLKTNIWKDGKFCNEVTIGDINDYARKIFGQLEVTNLNTQPSIEIYPMDKHSLAKLINKELRTEWVYGEVKGVDLMGKQCYYQRATMSREEELEFTYVINTISLPIFLKLCQIPHDVQFEHHPFWTAMISMGCDTHLYQMIYNVDSYCSITRTTLLNDELFIETLDAALTKKDLEFLKTIYLIDVAPAFKRIVPGRFRPLARGIRKPIFYYLTGKYNAFCIGRFGAWTNKVANDVWDDTDQICNWIYNKEQIKKYETRIKSNGII